MRLWLVMMFCFGCLVYGGLAQAQFTIVSQTAIYNPVTDDVEFTIEFSEPPDFFTVDGSDRQAHAFQYFIDHDSHFDYAEFDVLIRGGEIHWVGVLPVRDREGDGGEHAGGWGPIRCTVAFNVNGSTLTFTVSRICLNDVDGTFSYRLMTTEYGAMQDSLEDVSTVAVPFETGTWGQIKSTYR